jgi:hypothetical protein
MIPLTDIRAKMMFDTQSRGLKVGFPADPPPPSSPARGLSSSFFGRINRKPEFIETTVCYRKQRTGLLINRQLFNPEIATVPRSNGS